MLTLRRTKPDDPDFLHLVDLLDKDLWNRYPETQQNFVGFNKIKVDANVIVAFEDDKPVGCGCFRDTNQDNVIEIKRMYVSEDSRGKGIAKTILNALEEWAKEKGKGYSILETGTNQPEAISLYKKIGYEEIEKFEPYVESTESVCMGKEL